MKIKKKERILLKKIINLCNIFKNVRFCFFLYVYDTQRYKNYAPEFIVKMEIKRKENNKVGFKRQQC